MFNLLSGYLLKDGHCLSCSIINGCVANTNWATCGVKNKVCNCLTCNEDYSLKYDSCLECTTNICTAGTNCATCTSIDNVCKCIHFHPGYVLKDGFCLLCWNPA